NKIVDGPTGDGSLSIDIPQGGLAFVIGNIIEKGPMTANSTVIGYGEEGFRNPDTDFYFINNTIVTDRNPTTFFEIAAGTPVALIANNIIAGTGHPITGFTDTEANVINAGTSFFHFEDPTNYDYHSYGFPGFKNAIEPGTVDGFLLVPISQYVDPEDSMPRPDFIVFDPEVGAFESISGVGLVTKEVLQWLGGNYPNPFTHETMIPISGLARNFEIFDALGNRVDVHWQQTLAGILLERETLPAGIYFYRVSQSGTIVQGSLVIRD
ncbi:MAG TPA: T9SS type A sorting domain-containing protein, partial [Candidatus Kapabacteria bacterium]|nr:T9SS type A sorting domain-containing protein [Candidatus Kapabacteria bacterium]